MKIIIEGVYKRPGASGVGFSGKAYSSPPGATNFVDDFEIDKLDRQFIDNLICDYLDQKKQINCIRFEQKSDYI